MPLGDALVCIDASRDVEQGQILTYAIVDDSSDRGWFEINPLTGQLQITPTAEINYENGVTQVTLTVECKDDGQGELSDTALVTITILDVNEPPIPRDDVGNAMVPENRPTNYMVNGKFENGANIGGMLRCQSKFACEHLMGEGPDKYFNHVDMNEIDCSGCSIVESNKWLLIR